ncbi:MIT domain-containing protein 1 [Aphelenchoides avenae]|nr:MIT domain-containing protein 1 [Aphelenchus avenae]
MLRCKAQNLDRVVLITQQRPEENPDQKTALDALSDSFRKHNITLNVVFREFHERYVRFNNGYEVSMTRGLDIYQPLARLALGTHHYSLRQCREATFHITKKN